MTPNRLRAIVMLCDAAQQIGGKLYILGGGWSHVLRTGPLNMAVAVQILVPWNETNRRFRFDVLLLTADGQPAPAEEPSRASGVFEVGRPPGITQGSDLPASLVVSATGVNLPTGGYRWELHVEGEILGTVPFEVVDPPPGYPMGAPPSTP